VPLATELVPQLSAPPTSSEHGVGSRKRDYLSMSRTESDIAAMRAVKATFDPDGYLNRAVLFG